MAGSPSSMLLRYMQGSSDSLCRDVDCDVLTCGTASTICQLAHRLGFPHQHQQSASNASAPLSTMSQIEVGARKDNACTGTGSFFSSFAVCSWTHHHHSLQGRSYLCSLVFRQTGRPAAPFPGRRPIPTAVLSLAEPRGCRRLWLCPMSYLSTLPTLRRIVVANDHGLR